MSAWEIGLMVAVGLFVGVPGLLLLVVSGHRGSGAQPIGKASDTPPRPTPLPRPPQTLLRTCWRIEGDIMIEPKPPANPRLKDRG